MGTIQEYMINTSMYKDFKNKDFSSIIKTITFGIVIINLSKIVFISSVFTLPLLAAFQTFFHYIFIIYKFVTVLTINMFERNLSFSNEVAGNKM